MSMFNRAARYGLLLLTLIYLGVAVRTIAGELMAADGLLLPDGATPVGGDFVNMFAAARLVLEGRVGEIYQPQAFIDFTHTLIPHDIGIRMWAYPPHSLLLIWPLGLLNYWTALGLWSVLGLVVLAWGARRAGFDWLETAVIVLSPASVACVYYGQTGNVAAGLLLLALTGGRGLSAPLSAALLTVKPQAGFLLPVLWLKERKFAAIAIAAGAIIGLAALSLVFGIDAWRDYLGPTLGTLGEFEREERGRFLTMIPSVFIGMRLYAGDAVLAGYLHGAVAAAAAAFGLWRLWRTDDERLRWAIVIATMALVTPYIHIYDLAPVAAAGLILLARRQDEPIAAQLVAALVALAAWALPLVTVWGNTESVPLGPLVLIALLATVASPPSRPSPIPAAVLTEKS